MEYKTNYRLGDVVSIMDYCDTVLVGIVKSISIEDFDDNDKVEIYYIVKIGKEKACVPEEHYDHNDGSESMYRICGKVGNIYKITD
jgi:hypothetical protein